MLAELDLLTELYDKVCRHRRTLDLVSAQKSHAEVNLHLYGQ